MKEVLFFRHFRRFTGGHLKVWDYFNHVMHSSNHVPRICFSKESVWDERNPWHGRRHYVVETGMPARGNILFLGALDWLNVPEDQRDASKVPIINFIQHLRHSWPEDPRYTFLRYRAIRICVSEEVAATLRETRRVEGPLYVIPNAIDPKLLPQPIPFFDKDIDILIVANKQPTMGRLLGWRLWRPGRRIRLLRRQLVRREFLHLLNRAKTTVFLPNRAEGHYLPALEGMALGTIVVCPDCIGNRSFCRPDWNCFRPEYTLGAIVAAAEAAARPCPAELEFRLANARETVARHDLVMERSAFLGILESVDQLW